MSKGTCNVNSGMTRQRKGKAKRIGQEAQSRKQTIEQNDNVSERLEKSVWKRTSSSVLSTAQQELIVATESVIVGTHPHCKHVNLNIRVLVKEKKTNSHIWTWSRRAAETEDLQMHHRMTKSPQSGRRSKKILQSMEIPTSQRALQDKRTLQRCQRKKKTEVTSPQKVKNTATGLAMHSKERTYIVDSVASLHVMGFSSPNHKKKIIRRSSKILDVQTANGIVVSHTPAKVHIEELGACPWIHLVKDSRRYCVGKNEILFSRRNHFASVIHLWRWWLMSSVQPATTALFSDFVDILSRSVRLALKVDEIQLQLFSLQQSRSPPLSRPCAADNVDRCAQTAEGNLWARASPCWKHLTCRQRKIDGRGKLFTDSTDKKDSCRRANGKTDEEVDPLRKVVDDAEILEVGEFLACQKQRWNAQHTLRRNWQTNQCWRWMITSKNQSRKQNWADHRYLFSKEGSWGIDVKVPSTSNPE